MEHRGRSSGPRGGGGGPGSSPSSSGVGVPVVSSPQEGSGSDGILQAEGGGVVVVAKGVACARPEDE
eukprot:4595617-Pyramimonas_sp.AAC.2